MALKDRCTDTMLKVNLATRDESASGFEELVTEIRNDHWFKQDYPLFSCINLDMAGEFTGAAFKAVLKRLRIT